MKLICPMCHVPMTSDPAHAGGTVQCPTCKHQFQAGATPQQAQPVNPPPPPPPPAGGGGGRAPCPFCGHSVAPGAVKCPNCKGTIGAVNCSGCQEKVPADTAVCPHCQTQLKAGAPSPGAMGAQPQKRCPACGSMYPQTSAMCDRCRVPLGPVPQSKMLCGLIAIFVPFGIHRFLMGYTTMGVVQIIVCIVTCGIGCIWPFIEGIMILMGSLKMADGQDLTD